LTAPLGSEPLTVSFERVYARSRTRQCAGSRPRSSELPAFRKNQRKRQTPTTAWPKASQWVFHYTCWARRGGRGRRAESNSLCRVRFRVSRDPSRREGQGQCGTAQSGPRRKIEVSTETTVPKVLRKEN